jgi:hypothetical protein
MAQQAAFAQIPDAVKRVRIAPVDPSRTTSPTYMHLFLPVYRSLSSSRFGKQPRRDNSRLRQRLEPTYRKVLCENRMARSGGHRTPCQRRFAPTHPLAAVVSPRLICADQLFLILYRELYYRHVYSRLQPDIDDRFHSYENSCELFNYLLSAFSLEVPSPPVSIMAFSQIRKKVLYRSSFRNSGCGISSMSLSINSSPSTSGARE